ncbi:polysaccharide deacetylase family protein [Paenibacillus sp. HJGM_3]|uniref:polysaccharide deacetylase family protein n=1 Tax=Paenibacillus sp. HJGM_3 TaxID=3379816 RepID=UPI00385BD89F
MLRTILNGFILVVIGMSLLLPQVGVARDGIYYRDQVAVLMYHHVSDTDESSSTITTDLFRSQLTYLRDKGYTFITPEELHGFLEGGAVPPNAVLVTFDDGYASFYEHAYPILEQLQVPAVNFLITETLDHPDYNPYIGAIPFMSREQVRDMTHKTSWVKAACHTNGNHNKQDGKAYLTNRLSINNVVETEQQYEERILWDTQACLQEVSALTDEMTIDLAYPFGISTEKARELLQQCGVKFAYTITPQMTTRSTDPMRIPRINGGSPDVSPELLHQTIVRRVVKSP